jgi:uncharacterized protein (TIGR02118 family)
MYKMFSIWPEPDDVEAFEKYYNDGHMPIAAAMPGLRGLVLTPIRAGVDGGPADYYRVAELSWDSKEAFEATHGTPEFEAAVVDTTYMVETFGVTPITLGGDSVSVVLG